MIWLTEYCLPDGITDNTADIQCAIANHRTIFVPPTEQPFVIGSSINIPANTTLYGAGWNSQFKIINVDPENISTNYAALQIAPDAVNIHLNRIRFFGENSPFMWGFNPQSSVLRASDNDNDNISVTGCYFTNLYGGPIFLLSLGQNSRITGNWFFDCANGVVSGMDHGHYSHNLFVNSESLELTGSYIQATHNIVINGQGAGGIVYGGRVSEGLYSHDGLISDNIIINQISGAGIALGRNSFNAVVRGNTVINPATYGILVSNPNPLTPINSCRIEDNEVRECVTGVRITPNVYNALLKNNRVSGESAYCYHIDSDAILMGNTGEKRVFINNYLTVAMRDNYFPLGYQPGTSFTISPYQNRYQESGTVTVPVLVSPNNAVWKLSVNDAGELSVESI